MSKPVCAFLGLGSNLGEREDNLYRALTLLSKNAELQKISSIYETEPVGYEEQPWFLNLVCRIGTALPPRELLRLAKEIEGWMGRIVSFVNAPRPMDIDILLYGDMVMETKDLTVPHPRLKDRAFVLIPLAEIAPDRVHPVLGATILELLYLVEGKEGVLRYKGGLDVSVIRGRAL